MCEFLIFSLVRSNSFKQEPLVTLLSLCWVCFMFLQRVLTVTSVLEKITLFLEKFMSYQEMFQHDLQNAGMCGMSAFIILHCVGSIEYESKFFICLSVPLNY